MKHVQQGRKETGYQVSKIRTVETACAVHRCVLMMLLAHQVSFVIVSHIAIHIH